MVSPAPPSRARRNGAARPPFPLPPHFCPTFPATQPGAGRGRSVLANQRRQRRRALPLGAGREGGRGPIGGGALWPGQSERPAAEAARAFRAVLVSAARLFCREKVGSEFQRGARCRAAGDWDWGVVGKERGQWVGCGAGHSARGDPAGHLVRGGERRWLGLTERSRPRSGAAAAMSGFDDPGIYYSDSFGGDASVDEGQVRKSQLQKRFKEFLRQYRVGTDRTGFTFKYRCYCGPFSLSEPYLSSPARPVCS